MREQSSSAEQRAEVYLRLEQYSDIFSDFDMRPFSRRALSIDFLEELKRAAAESVEGGIELMLHMPETKRKDAEEEVIKERLAAHFKKHFHLLQIEKKKILRFGIFMVILGIISMAIASFLYSKDDGSFLSSFLIIFFEPAAWFLWWEGLDQILFNSKKINPELNFYRKMFNSHKHIYFKSY